MSASVKSCLKLATACVAISGLIFAASPARADDYTDLLDILRAKGSLTAGEYNTLMAKHRHPTRAARHARAAASADTADTAPIDDSTDVAAARQAAASAAASAAAAQAAATSTEVAMKSPDIVRVAPYVPAKGVTLHAGSIDINLSGFVNGFYTFDSPNHGTPVAGGLSSGGAGFDSSSIRNGLLPGALILSLKTQQSGFDMSAVFGVYPGLNSATNGAFNANSGGSAVALGTAGIDFRQSFVTVGRPDFGTVKVGRDIGLFGADAIFDDATLLSVGSPGGNTAPANTSLGRIGVGYVYADFIPQITYSTPIIHGFQANVGVFTPLDPVNFAGGGLSAVSGQHSAPMFQGKLTYDFDQGVKGRIWVGGLVENQRNVVSALIANPNRSVTAAAGDIGTKLDYGPFGTVLYAYRGSGLGTTGLFFDGIAANGRKRDSEGFYVQGSYKLTPKLKFVGSYGQSSLFQAPGENSPLLVRRNESEIGAAYYTLTDWMTLVGEFVHTMDKAHGGNKGSDTALSVGTIVFF